MKKIGMLAMFLGIALGSLAQSIDTLSMEEVVVVGSRFEEPIKSLGKSVYHQRGENIRQSAAISVGEVLNRMPGIFVNGSGGPLGTDLSYYSRGMGSEHSMILLDGIPVTDPSFPGSFFDLRHVSLEDVSSIELIQNGMSTLFGSGASGSVINIRSRKAMEPGLSGNASMGYGSWNTRRGNLSLRGAGKLGSITASISGLSSEGFSSATDESGNQSFDADGMTSLRGSLGAEWFLSDTWRVQAGYQRSQFVNQYDFSAFTDGEEEAENTMNRWYARSVWENEKLRWTTDMAFLGSEREYRGTFPGIFRGREFYSDMNVLMRGDDFHGMAGVTFRNPAMNTETVDFSTSTMMTGDIYAQGGYKKGVLRLDGGIRLHTAQNYAPQVLYMINPSIHTNWKSVDVVVYSQYSTSFLAPSPAQLYGFAGNVNLLPESTRQAEWGMRLNKGSSQVNVTHFQRGVYDKILYVFSEGVGQLVNIEGKRRINGWEVAYSYQGEHLNLSTSYSNIGSADIQETTSFIPILLRMPAHNWKGSVAIRLFSSMYLSSDFQWVGARDDMNWAEYQLTSLPRYFLLNAAVGYEKNAWRAAFKIRNVTQSDYIQIFGYNTQGRNFELSTSFRF